MAEESNDIKVISRKNSGFPEWLDFAKLRSEGIEYLGRLSGKIWTDHNVHDPGITILEVLCYALIDLGYRSNLPVEDIFTRNPDDKSDEDNFFTPSQILTNNPLTITDYRKLLIDIKEIKNAWLEVAIDEDPNKFCNQREPPPDIELRKNKKFSSGQIPKEKDPCCIHYLNGLYHIYLDLEKNIEKEFEGKPDEKKKFINCLIKKVKKTLLTHRNICEDFLDIRILCKWPIGVCVEIELEENADPEKVYLEIAAKLRQFFSPSPHFYTLPQLLEANKTIDEIFAGRPFDIKSSHGFVDVKEFEELTLRKSIHVSDVYNVLFSINGINKIQHLRLKDCSVPGNLRQEEWVIKIPEDHVPDFCFTGSFFQFSRQGINVSFDFRKYDALLELNFEQNGKIFYPFPSEALDVRVPTGYYHKELGSYSSIQQEFPRVYGISEGGLAESASTFRKAQAYQLKGYLLFFDQLLANYLSQLKSIRSLFSLSLPDKEDQPARQTYYSAIPQNVPDFKELVRYKIDEESENMTSGDTGFLAFPVSKQHLVELIEQEKLKSLDIEKIPYFGFGSVAGKEIAISQLIEDMWNEAITINYVTKSDECVYYYIFCSSEDFALIGRKYYTSEKAAMVAAASVKYAGSIRTNYKSAILSEAQPYSFSVDLSFSSYSYFLQQLIEDETLYQQRRQSFLDHILARFAEKFTDYALLSYHFNNDHELSNQDILAKQKFLSSYPLLSSTRGKAFDYSADGWYSENNSGFEKRIQAYMGHREYKRKSLCNFAVYEYEEKYMFRFSLGNELYFKSDEKFDTRTEAQFAARKYFSALRDKSNFTYERIPHQNNYAILINYGTGQKAVLSKSMPSESDAKAMAEGFHKMIVYPERNGKVNVATERHTASLTNQEGKIIRTLAEKSFVREETKSTALKSLPKINDPKIWEPGDTTVDKLGKLLGHPSNQENLAFIDQDLYKIDIDNTIVGKPDKFNFEILDKNHHFKFRSIPEYGTAKKAREACYHTLSLLTVDDNLHIEVDKRTAKWNIYIQELNNQIAVSSAEYDIWEEAEQARDIIQQIVKRSIYRILIDAMPHSWNFTYELGYEPGKIYKIQSENTYPDIDKANQAMGEFMNALGHAKIELVKKDWVIRSGDNKKLLLGRFTNLSTSGNQDENVNSNAAIQLLELQQQMHHMIAGVDAPESFNAYVDVHEESKCRWVYHLVDKDALYAVHARNSTDRTELEDLRKQVIRKNSEEYNFLDLYMRGDYVVKERKGNGKTKWYHYQISSSNLIRHPLGGAPKRIVLFESTKGYSSKEEAQQAFSESYFSILTLGLKAENYGEGKPISEKPILIQIEDFCLTSESIVFIPEETIRFLGTYPQQAIGELINILRSYPVRSILKEEHQADFEKRFLPCKKESLCEEIQIDSCSGIKEKPVYFFVLFDKLTKQEDWHSVESYSTAEEAMKAFRFFLLLLKYEGNFFIDCDCTGSYKIFIREVLAESADRYSTEQLAWGMEGIEKFIGLSQSKQAFHPYVDEQCCHRFFVACKNFSLVHPCSYDSAELRDTVIRKLQHMAPQLLKWNFESFCETKWEGLLKDLEGNPLSIVTFKENNGKKLPATILDEYIAITNLIGRFGLCVDEENNKLFIKSDKHYTVDFTIAPGSGINTIKELKERLLKLTCYFPFYRNDNNIENPQHNPGKYCIEIRLPGFNTCNDCKGNDEVDDQLCPVAWASECCFASCADLLTAFRDFSKWLQEFNLYLPVFDCDCGPYRIELYRDARHCIDSETSSKQSKDEKLVKEPHRIIAKNPQCFPTAEMVCDAIKRAKDLINNEGLHVVEHILLRPHCQEDCKCLVSPCKSIFDSCEFPYWEGKDDEDPCDITSPVCFRPGYDPYSFIATVVLPGWPEKFRKKENRILIENMLYREAPAHVALRILWLNPHDLCCFERHYKRWLIWIAYKKSCTDDYQICEFVNFLFNREFDCLKDYPECETCEQEPKNGQSCVDQMKEYEIPAGKKDCITQTWLEQINDLHCWNNCRPGAFEICEKPVSTGSTTGKIDKRNFVNARFTAYKKNADEIVDLAKGNKLAVKARLFLNSVQPSPGGFQELIRDLLKIVGQKGQKKELLTGQQALQLIALCTYFVLDKNLFNGGKPSGIEKYRNTFDEMKKSKIDTGKMYQDWNAPVIKELEPELKLAEVRKLIVDG